MNDCCALCGTFSCDCGPDAPCNVERRNRKPIHIPKRDDDKNAFHVPVVFDGPDNHLAHVQSYDELLKSLEGETQRNAWNRGFDYGFSFAFILALISIIFFEFFLR